MTASEPTIIENLALSTASLPSVGPTWVSKVFLSGAGSAPVRSTATRSLASCCSWNGSEKPPMVMRAWPPPMRASMTGAELILSSRMMAILRPMFGARDLLEQVGALVVEGERDLGTAGLRIPVHLGVGDVLAGQLGAAVQVVGAPQLVRAVAVPSSSLAATCS